MAAPRPTRSPARRPLPCVHLGKVIRRVGCVCRRKDVRACDKGHGHVQQFKQCETCPEYEADEDANG